MRALEPLWIGLFFGVALLAAAGVVLWRLRRAHQRLAAANIELRNQAELQRSIVDSMSEGVFVADARGQLVLVNPAAERIVGIGFSAAASGEWSQRYGLHLLDPVSYTHLTLPTILRV